MGASAVAAAVIPSKNTSDSKERVAGQLVASTGDASGQTCINAGSGAACDYTATGNAAGQSSTSRTNASDDLSTTANAGNPTETSTTHLP